MTESLKHLRVRIIPLDIAKVQGGTMTASLQHLRELSEPELLNKDTLLIPKAGVDRWGWLPDQDTLLIPKAGVDRWGWLPDQDTLLIKQINLKFLLAQRLRYRWTNNTLLRNSLYIMSSTFATAVIGYLFWIVAAHLYSTHDVGLASALIAVMTLASMLANFGIGPTLVQTLPRRESGFAYSLTLNAGLVTGTLTSLLVGSMMIVILPNFSQQFAIVGHQAAYAISFVACVALWTISTLLDQTFVAERAAGKMLVRNVAFALLKLLLMVLLVQMGALGIFSSSALALAIAVMGAGFLLVPRLGRAYCLALRGIWGQMRSMLSSFVGHHFISLGYTTPMYLLPVFVAARLSLTDTAYFYTTWMLGSILFMVSPAVAASLFAEGSHKAGGLLHKARASAVIIGTLLGPVMLVFLVGGRYILALFGPRYAQHGLLLLTILTVSAIPDAITNIYVSVLRVQKQLRWAALFNLGMGALVLACAWIVLPMLGIAGAGFAWLIAQIIGSLVVAAHGTWAYFRRQQAGSCELLGKA
jgi:O-antigen/teichoic acid export membrane protein